MSFHAILPSMKRQFAICRNSNSGPPSLPNRRPRLVWFGFLGFDGSYSRVGSNRRVQGLPNVGICGPRWVDPFHWSHPRLVAAVR